MKNKIKIIGYVVFAVVGCGALAQTYPSRPVRLIVGFPPGGPTDLVARLVGQHLSEALGQQIVTDNRPGAGGAVAGMLMVKAAPDGHTLFLASNGEIAISPNLYKKMVYDPARDLVPVSRVGAAQLVLVVNPSLPAQSVKELIVLARAKPGAINFASSGIGSTAQLSAEMLKVLANIDITHVPYKGAGPALTDVMGGQVQMLISGFSSAITHIKSGKLRALGVTGVTRVKSMPDLPTIGETVPGYQMNSWYGVFSPRGTPQAIVDRLQHEVAVILKKPEVNERMAGLGIEPEASTSAVFARQIVEEIAKWAKIIQVAKVPLQ